MNVGELRKLLEPHSDETQVVLRQQVQPGDDYADYEIEEGGCPGGAVILTAEKLAK